jgi:hypothetical protein
MTSYSLLLWDLDLILVGSFVVLCCVCVVGLVFRGVLRNIWLPLFNIICSLLIDESR